VLPLASGAGTGYMNACGTEGLVKVTDIGSIS
jgi:hypothetical protein